jgi:hypothetical protein
VSPKLFLRGAALVTVLLAAGHMLGSPWTPVVDPSARDVVVAMKAHRFDVMGLRRSYFDFYEGFGWMLSAYLIGHAILFWQLSGLAMQRGIGVRPIVAVLCLEAFAAALVAWRFLFWVPTVMSGAIAACLAVSVALMAQRQKMAMPTPTQNGSGSNI